MCHINPNLRVMNVDSHHAVGDRATPQGTTLSLCETCERAQTKQGGHVFVKWKIAPKATLNKMDESDKMQHGAIADEEAPLWFTNNINFPRSSHYISFNDCNIHFLKWQNKTNTHSCRSGLLLLHGNLAHAHW